MTYSYPEPSVIVFGGMAAIAIGVAMLVLWLVQRSAPRLMTRFAVGIVAMMLLQLGLAEAGVLRHWKVFPPPIVPLLLVTFALTVYAALGPAGKTLASASPFSVLVGFQFFRLPLELLMHQAAIEGVMPSVMSYSGYNFDILSGLTALPLAWLTHKHLAPRWLLLCWNAMGSFLLAVIVGIAIAATPVVKAFGPEQLNVWVADVPFVWLPGVMVQAALFGHLLVWQKLRS